MKTKFWIFLLSFCILSPAIAQDSITNILPAVEATTINDFSKIVENQGFSFMSLGRGILGMLVLLLIAFLFSVNRKAINWKTVGIGLGIQLILAIGILKVPFIRAIFSFLGKIFNEILNYTIAGSEFLLGNLLNLENPNIGYVFAFQILPTIIFFSALTSVLFYLGIIQKIVKGLAWLLTKTLGISGPESLSVAGNIFLGQTEAPLMIKAYLEKMNKSEILLVMIGGMATVAGGVLAAYIGFLGGNDEQLRLEFARHLIAASVMAAPGAIVISKMLYPQTEKINTDVTVSNEKIGANLLDAISNGTTEGLKLAEAILGTIFAPLMWLIGVANEDIMLMGQLLGIKLASSEFVGYTQLASLKDMSNATHFTRYWVFSSRTTQNTFRVWYESRSWWLISFFTFCNYCWYDFRLKTHFYTPLKTREAFLNSVDNF